MAYIQYKVVKGKCVTPCPFGRDIMVGSAYCEFCSYHCKSNNPDCSIICNYDIAHPEKGLRNKMKLWEYKIINLDGLDLKDENERFNNLGSDGWELVTCYCSQAFFKREIQNG